MTGLERTRSIPGGRQLSPTRAATGAVLGALLWLECVAFGLPSIVFGAQGYSVIPIAALVGGVLGMTPVRRLLWGAAAAGALVLAVVAYTPIMWRPVRALIRVDAVSRRPIQAVVVLSGAITRDGHLRGQSIDRLLTGLDLLRRGSTTTIMLSRLRVGRGRSQVTSDADQQRLIALLDRPVRILVADSAHSTRDEAVRMRALARPLGISSVAVVTSPLHTRRSCATFEKIGFAVTCVPSESRDVALSSLSRVSDRVRAFQLWLYEQAALVLYRARGWI
jgi:uncharacterized SAM-binding protein YcdF (DUF218 family)